MIKNTTKMMLFMALFTVGFNLNSQEQVSAQDAIALKMIEAMQGCINFNKQAQQPFDAHGVSEQRSAWDKAVAQYHEYMGDLRAQNSHIEKAAPAHVTMSEKAADDLSMQMNESKFLFARLLDAYIAYLGQVYEKKGYFRNTYYIASNSNPTLSIMPNEYNLFMQTLQSAAQQSDWGKTLNLTLPVIAENRLISDKNFTLNEIITAVRNVPLPAGYSNIARGIAIGATAGAIAVGAYYAYNNMDQLQDSMNDIQAYFNQPSNPAPQISVATPAVEFVAAIKPEVTPEPTFLENAQSGFRRGVYGDEAVTVEGALAGGDAENYGLSGYSGQETLGAVGLSAALGAGAAQAANAHAALPASMRPGISLFKENIKNPEIIKNSAKNLAKETAMFSALGAGLGGGLEAALGNDKDHIIDASIKGATYGAMAGATFGAGGTAAKLAGYGSGTQLVTGIGTSMLPSIVPNVTSNN